MSSAGTIISPRSVVSDIDKPLPPAPMLPHPLRKSSSVYSLQVTAAKAPRGERKQDLLPYHQPRPLPARAYTANTDERKPGRPKLVKSSEPHIVSVPMLDPRAKYPHETNRYEGQIQQRAEDAVKREISISNMTLTASTAKDRTMEYFGIREPFGSLRGGDLDPSLKRPTMPSRKTSQVPPDVVIDVPYSDESYLPASMSPRITDVIDHSMVPSPLHVDAESVSPAEKAGLSLDQESRPSTSSQFSSDSSHSDISSIIDNYLGKRRWIKKSGALRSKPGRHKSSSGSTQKGRKSSHTSSTFSRLSSSFSATRGRLGSAASHRRKSVARGIDSMYDTLTKFSLAPRPVTPLYLKNNKKRAIPRAKRSPAIPITPYQMYGRKAWEMEKAAKSPKKPKFRISTKRKKPGSIEQESSRDMKYKPLTYSTLMNPPKTAPLPSELSKDNRQAVASEDSGILADSDYKFVKPEKQSKADKRREELKKKIVVIGLGEGRPASGGPWI